MEASGAAAKKAAVKSSNYFSNMALAGERSPFLKEIEQVRLLCCMHIRGSNAAASAAEVLQLHAELRPTCPLAEQANILARCMLSCYAAVPAPCFHR
jgi:hypothetical protein